MARTLALPVLLAFFALAACSHEPEAAVAYPTTQVTVVQQTTVQQTVPVHVHYGRPIDCDMMCGSIERACERACVPTAWSPNMRSIQDHCESDCDFQRFACVGDCVRSGGHSRTR